MESLPKCLECLFIQKCAELPSSTNSGKLIQLFQIIPFNAYAARSLLLGKLNMNCPPSCILVFILLCFLHRIVLPRIFKICPPPTHRYAHVDTTHHLKSRKDSLDDQTDYLHDQNQSMPPGRLQIVQTAYQNVYVPLLNLCSQVDSPNDPNHLPECLYSLAQSVKPGRQFRLSKQPARRSRQSDKPYGRPN